MGQVGEHLIDFGVVWLLLWLSYVVNLHAADTVFLAESICELNHMVGFRLSLTTFLKGSGNSSERDLALEEEGSSQLSADC